MRICCPQPYSGRPASGVVNSKQNLKVEVEIGILNLNFTRLKLICPKLAYFLIQAIHSSFRHIKTESTIKKRLRVKNSAGKQ